MKEILIRMSEQEYAYMIHKSHIMGDEELYTRHGILTRAFERRTELPKGHGELRDGRIIERFKERIKSYGNENEKYTFSVEEVLNILGRYEGIYKEVLIEADKGEE